MMCSDGRILLTVTLVFAVLGARNADLPNGGRPVEYENGGPGVDKTGVVEGEEHEMEARHI
jgi:hypothetical protein